MARKIVITSGKGGVGKTTISYNLGQRLSNSGFRVVVLDVDIGLNNLDVVAGIDNRVVYDIVDIVEGKCRIKQALLQDERNLNLYYLPTAHSYNSGKVSTNDLIKIVKKLEEIFEYVLIDCPAGIERGFSRAIFVSSEAIIVTTPHITAIRDADKVANILASQNISNIGVVVNRVRNDLVKQNKMLSPNTISECLGLKLIGNIPESDELSSQASLNGGVLYLEDETLQAFCVLCDNVVNGGLLHNKEKPNFYLRRIKNVNQS